MAMNRALITSLVAFTLVLACKASEQTPDGTGGSPGAGGAATGGRSGSGGNVSGTGGAGTSAGSGGSSATGGSTGTGGSVVGTGGSGGGTADASSTGGSMGTDAPTSTSDASDAPAASDAPKSDRPAILSEGADYPGRPEVRICPKDWTHEQCCEFLCRCLNDLCTDSPKGKPGIATCKTWCPKLSNMAMRCHVYHCFESVSTGGRKDHDSHCGHAADQVGGGMCRADVYN
jgi:hypothetical protein